jgi:hypothetical protein
MKNPANGELAGFYKKLSVARELARGPTASKLAG